MLQPQAAGQPDDRSKHKFMVQWVAVPNSYTEDVDTFVRNIKKTNLISDVVILFKILVETRFEKSWCTRFKIKMLI